MRTLFTFFIVTLAIFAQADEEPSSYNPLTIQTFKGQVISIQRFSFVNRPVPYVQFIMQSEENEYTVEVGPEWFLEVGGVLIVPREEIEVKGSLIVIGNKKIILANQIKKGSAQLKLRSADGTPYWGQQRNLQY